MKENEMQFYESPNMEVLEIVVESPVLVVSGGMEDLDSVTGTWK